MRALTNQRESTATDRHLYFDSSRPRPSCVVHVMQSASGVQVQGGGERVQASTISHGGGRVRAVRLHAG